ncbi:MAG: histidine phosphatase family protein [Myxococcota bacterium]
MTETVYLIRHGVAEGMNPAGDHARRLTDEGRARFLAHVTALRPELSVRRILASPLVRAQQTAGLLAHVVGATVETEETLACGHLDGGGILKLAQQLGPNVALVGHNPEMADAVTRAAGRATGFNPGTVAALTFSGGRAVLLWARSP